MTDKQIIIDGIDVSGCDCYCDGKCLCEYNEINRKIIRYYSCNKFPNCYYKQLKRKEQECDELNADNISLRDRVGKLERAILRRNDKLDQLQAENEELKKQIDDLLHKPEIQDKILWKIDNEALLGSKDAYIYKLKQTLEEIKEIARVNSINTCWTAINLCVDCDEIEECGLQSPFEKLKAIIQKIRECEGE